MSNSDFDTSNWNGITSLKGSSASQAKWDMSGKPICRYCGKGQDDLEVHLMESHNICIEEYQEKHPEHPITSRTDVGSAENLSFKKRESKEFSVEESFGFLWGDDGSDKIVHGYAEPGPLTPKIEESYVFNRDITKISLMGLHLKDRILMYGMSGTGKSSLWEQICARLNYNFVRINFDDGISRADLVGRWIARGNKMEFAHGILPNGMLLTGSIICLDEWDTISSSCSFVLQRVLEKESQLLIMENDAQIITMHPDNMIVATANTCGMGDETGLYSGTRQQNFSQINRFSLTIETKYLSEDEETNILLRAYRDGLKKEEGVPRLSEREARAMVKVANAMRECYNNTDIAFPLTTRDLLNWAEKYLIWGSPSKSALFCFINRYPLEDRDTVQGIIQRLIPEYS